MISNEDICKSASIVQERDKIRIFAHSKSLRRKQMKRNHTILWMLAAILLCGTITVTSCKSKTNEAPVEEQVTETVAIETELTAIEKYLVDSIGVNYLEAEICIPCGTIIATDTIGSGDEFRVWGDYWVFNYNLMGDTLKLVSGGSHPGMMNLKKTDNGYEVVAFEQVEDGAGHEASAKRIFGEHFEAFWKINSDADAREVERERAIAKYVSEHQLSAKYYQDYGWPAVKIEE